MWGKKKIRMASDLLMVFLLPVLMAYSLVGEAAHEWIGIVMFLLFLLHHVRHVLYNCSASRPSIESETKEDTIEPGTETLSITADPRSDGLVKARTGDTTDAGTYANWYKTVYIPTEEEASEQNEEVESV